jgi:hypothetical protein
MTPRATPPCLLLLLATPFALAIPADRAPQKTTKLSCALSVVSTDLTAGEETQRFTDETVVEVTEQGESLEEVNGTGPGLSFLFETLFRDLPGQDPSNYHRFLASKDSWSVDTRTRDMTRASENVFIIEKIFINRFTGTLTYLRDENMQGVSLKKVTATGQCEPMDARPPKF